MMKNLFKSILFLAPFTMLGQSIYSSASDTFFVMPGTIVSSINGVELGGNGTNYYSLPQGTNLYNVAPYSRSVLMSNPNAIYEVRSVGNNVTADFFMDVSYSFQVALADLSIQNSNNTATYQVNLEQIAHPGYNDIPVEWTITRSGATVSDMHNLIFKWGNGLEPNQIPVKSLYVFDANQNTWVQLPIINTNVDDINNTLVYSGYQGDLTATRFMIGEAVPTITLTGQLDTLLWCQGTPSNTQSFLVEAQNVINNVVLHAPTNFEVSLIPQGPFNDSIVFIPSGNNVGPVVAYIRIAANAAATGSFNIIANYQDLFYGNVADTLGIISVHDGNAPTLTAPSSLSLSADANCTAVVANLGNPISSDDCAVVSVTNDAPPLFPLGSTLVTWTATDAAGNSTTATQTITVIDNTNPTITAPANVTVSADNNCVATAVSLGTATTADNCTVGSVTNNAPATFPLGTTTVTWTVTDGSGNTATATQTVTVNDNTNPTITAPANVTVNANGTCNAFNVVLGTATTADNCSVASVTNNAPGTFPLGVTTVTWTVTDGSGNIATATQTVTVVDNANPSLVAPANMTVSAGNACTASIANLGNPVATDNCTIASVTNNAPAAFPLGNTTVTWTATDAAGNSTTATQTITVIDNTNPTITAPANVTVSADNNCVATAVSLGTATTADNCTVGSVTNNAPATFPLGTTTVTWTVTDGSGNTATATQTVTVNDNTNPTITAPANVTVNANGTCNAFNVVLGTATTADNCSVASVTNNAPGTFPLGVTTVTWTVTDGSGNIATATQTVTVNDTVVPIVIAPSNLMAYTTTQCDATNVSLGNPVVIENCGVQSIVNNAPLSFPLGTTIVTWTVTDNGGNATSVDQIVTVFDTTHPVLFTNNLNVVLDVNGNTAISIQDVDNGSTDNCGIEVMTLSQYNFDCSHVGNNSVIVTATDYSGNTTTGIISVLVQNTGIDIDQDGVSDECDTTVSTDIVEVPNGFTPDGDNFNDFFVIPIAVNYSNISLSVYNRYGSLVYEKENYSNDWDGSSSLNGEPLPDDTYYYVLTLDGEQRQGFVYINRVQY
jgi:gliding motility-associated-like protein